MCICRDNEIDKINTETFLMGKPNLISREEILRILKRASVDTDRRYSLLSILRYNIDLEPAHLNTYLKNKNKNSISYNFLTSIKNIDSISFQPTISLFHDLNNLFILFYCIY